MTADYPMFAAGWNRPGYSPDDPEIILETNDFEDARTYLMEEIERAAESGTLYEDDPRWEELHDEISSWAETHPSFCTSQPDPAGYVYWITVR